MSSSTASPAALQPNHLATLRDILRRANAHYHAVASSIRSSLNPTKHAKSRATSLNLSINVAKAVACPQKHVSVIPLPILDFTLSPTEAVAKAATELILEEENAATGSSLPLRRRAAFKHALPPIVIPSPGDRRRRHYFPSKVSAIKAPTVLRGGENPWRGETSRFSITPNDPIFQVAISKGRTAPDVPTDEEEVDWVEMDHVSLSSAGSSASDESDDSEKSSSSSSTSTSSSSSSSERDSLGPETPPDSPIMIRIKRKFDSASMSAQKPPKFLRKDWSTSTPSRI